jgi:hypothetical protein
LNYTENFLNLEYTTGKFHSLRYNDYISKNLGQASKRKLNWVQNTVLAGICSILKHGGRTTSLFLFNNIQGTQKTKLPKNQ